MNLNKSNWKPIQRYGEDYGLVYEDRRHVCKIGAKQNNWSLVLYENNKLIINKFNITLLELFNLLDNNNYQIPDGVSFSIKEKTEPYTSAKDDFTVDNLNESFDQQKYKKKAEKWLKRKFGKMYNFVHKPNLKDHDKTYHCSIDGVEFSIQGRKYDTTDDGVPDTVAYRIASAEEDNEEGF